MALQFRDSGSNYVRNASALGLTGYGLTFACRFRVLGTQTTYQPLMALNDVGAAPIIALMARMDEAGDPLQMQFFDGTSAFVANSVAAIADDTWYTAVGILESDKIHVHLNGVCTTTTITPATFPTGFDRFSLGSEERFSLKISNVDIEDICVWNVALTEAEAQRYAAEKYSRSIRIASIVGQWDGRRTSSPIPANVGTYDLSVVGTVPTASTSPTVNYAPITYIPPQFVGDNMADRSPIASITYTVSSTALSLSDIGFTATQIAAAKRIVIQPRTYNVVYECVPSFTPTASSGRIALADVPPAVIEVARGEGLASNFRIIRQTVDASTTITLEA